MGFMEGDRRAALRGRDGCREPAQTAPDHGHILHGPYHTVWYARIVLRKSDWVQAGLAAVADDGPNGLRIDRLCRRLGVSKGSFHHHFAGSGDFKKTVLAAYETLVVEALEQAIDRTAADSPKAALTGLTAAIA